MDITRGNKYTIKANPRRAGGSRVLLDEGEVVTATRNGVDSDGDTHVRSDLTRVESWILPQYLEPVNATPAVVAERVPYPEPTDAKRASAAFKEGNEVEFTVTAQITGSTPTVTCGCKSIPLSVVLPLIYKLDKSVGRENEAAITFRGIVRDGKIGAGTTSVDMYEVDGYGRDVHIISTEVVTKPDVTVTLTHAQAEAIGAIAGRIGGSPDGPRGHIASGLTVINLALGYGDYSDNPASAGVTGNGIYIDKPRAS